MKIKQITEDDWNEIAKPLDLAIIPLLSIEFKRKFNIQPIEYDEDGLGRCIAFIFEIDGSKYWSRSFPDTNSDAQYLNISVLSTEPDSSNALNKLLDILGIKKHKLPWINKNIGPANWILIRIDDNGNETEMFRFQEESCANWVLNKYEKKRHKQHYYIRRAT